MDKILKIIIKVLPEIPKEEVGKYHYIPCPCGGQLRLIRDVTYGRLHVHCDTCGFELHE